MRPQNDWGVILAALFVHLSDIHFGQEKDGGRLRVNTDAKDRLLDDAQTEIDKMGAQATGIIVTGDIAYSARPEEYDDAGKWLDRLADRIGCSRLDIQMVPGNHDIDRSAIDASMRLILHAIRDHGDEKLDMLLDDEGGREKLFERFSAYREFATGYGCELDCRGEYSADGAIKFAEGRTLRFVRLNSALICSEADEEGKLILGARQRVIPTEPGEEVVVLLHHPLNWFQDSDDAKRYLKSRARVVISGHEHFPSLEVTTVEEGCDMMMLAAGATAPDEFSEKYTYKYNIIGFDWDPETDDLVVTINPRTWDDEHKRFMRDEPFLEGKQERNVLASPNFKRGMLPTAATEPPAQQERVQVQPVINPIAGGGQAAVAATVDERMLRLRFFRDLTEGQRLKILADLGAIPENLREKLDHAMEQRLFARLLRQGKSDALSREIETHTAKMKGGKAE